MDSMVARGSDGSAQGRSHEPEPEPRSPISPPESLAPEALAPETLAPEAPETLAPETLAPETLAPEMLTLAPEALASDPDELVSEPVEALPMQDALEPEPEVSEGLPRPTPTSSEAAEAGRWDDVVAALERRIADADDRHRIALYTRLGQVWEDKLHRERNALDAWHNADLLDNNDLDTLRALARLYRSTQAWEELVYTLVRMIDLGQSCATRSRAPAPPGRAAPPKAVQEGITEDELIEALQRARPARGRRPRHRVDEAIEAWRKVIAIDPSELRALDMLEKLLVRERRWEECIDVLEKRALVADDDERRCETLLQAATTWEEQVMDLGRAVQVYERVRRIDPENRVASDRLEVVYRSQRKWTELVEVLLERSEQVADVGHQIRILDEVAEVYERELHDLDSAFYVLCAAFNRDYTHAPTAKALERLATATKRWEELLGEYTSRVNELEREDRVAAIGLWVEIGRWYGEHLQHFDFAIHSVQQALRLDPLHAGALAVLADLQRKRGSWSELIDTLQRRAVVETEPANKAELYVALAELEIEKHRKDAGVSVVIDAYQHALDCDAASRPALTALDRLLRAGEQWEPLVDVLARRAELATDDGELVALRLELGQIWDLRLCQASPAIKAYQQVLDLQARNPTALRALEQLYEKTNQSEKYLDNLEAQLDISADDLERVALYERMAAVWEERFGKLDRAIDALEKIVALDARNDDAYRDLARLYRQAADWPAHVEALRRHVLATTDASSALRPVHRDGRGVRAEPRRRRRRDRGVRRGAAARPRRAARARRARQALRQERRVGARDRGDEPPARGLGRRGQAGRAVHPHRPHPVRQARPRRRGRGQPPARARPRPQPRRGGWSRCPSSTATAATGRRSRS